MVAWGSPPRASAAPTPALPRKRRRERYPCIAFYSGKRRREKAAFMHRPFPRARGKVGMGVLQARSRKGSGFMSWPHLGPPPQAEEGGVSVLCFLFRQTAKRESRIHAPPLPPRAGEGWDGGASGAITQGKRVHELAPPRPSPASGGGRGIRALLFISVNGEERKPHSCTAPSPARGERLGWGRFRRDHAREAGS